MKIAKKRKQTANHKRAFDWERKMEGRSWTKRFFRILRPGSWEAYKGKLKKAVVIGRIRIMNKENI